MQTDVWNDLMYEKHPTPYYGLAGIVEFIRVRVIHSYSQVKESESVCEIGCEAGNLILSFMGAKSRTGFDISRKALKSALEKSINLDIPTTFVQGDAERKLPFTKGQFDVIICSETLEHVLNPQKVVKSIAAICTKDTRVIITVPNESPKLTVKKWLKKFGLIKLVVPGIEDEQSEWHLHAFSREFLHTLVERDFRIIRSGGILGLHEIVELRKK